MNGEEIIDKFHTYTDDNSEISSSEELDLLNKVYKKVCRARHWEFLKTAATGTLDSYTDVLSYITLPANFVAFSENNNETNNTFEPQNNASPKVVFIIDSSGNYIPYQIVNFSDRRQYKNRAGFCYIDYANSRITFFAKPPNNSYEYDYIKSPTDLALNTSPIFHADFHDILYHGMAVDEMIIELFDRAHSYAPENRAKYEEYLTDMAWANAQLLMN